MPNPFQDTALVDYYRAYRSLRGTLSEQQCQPLLAFLAQAAVGLPQGREFIVRSGHSEDEATRLLEAVAIVMGSDAP